MDNNNYSVEQITTLTPLRGIAAIMVVLYHYEMFFGTIFSHSLTGIIANGYLWVDFFFLLSGFILSHVYGDCFINKLDLKTYKAFVWSRFARIYPLHFFVLILMLIIELIRFLSNPSDSFTGVFALKYFAQNLFLLNAMGLTDNHSWNGPSWSIGAEWYTYLLFPLLFLYISVLSDRIKIALFALLTLLLSLLPFLGEAPYKSLAFTYDYGILRCFLEFFIGTLIYRVYRSNIGYRIFSRSLSFIICLIAVLLSLHSEIHDTITILAFILFILCSASNRGWVRSALDVRPARLLGDISYSIYLTHMTIFLIYIRITPGFQFSAKHSAFDHQILLPAFIAIVILFSALTYFMVELPVKQSLKRWYNPPI